MPPRRRRERPDVPPALLPALVPPALHGVKTRAIGATAPLRLNLLLYGLAGLIMPFVGIKLIGLIMHNLLGA